MTYSKVLVVGATGLTGGKVVDQLLARGYSVRALVRPGSDASRLQMKGVEVVRGDLKDPGSLRPAVDGVSALITTAYGYAQRSKGDSLQAVDDEGNRALIDASKAAGLGLFVFTSILTADKAVSVPHFYQKARTEACLEASGVPFVSLRPGGFIDTLLGFSLNDIRRGRFRAMADPEARASTIHSSDVARLLVQALETPGAVGRRIDIGTDPATTSLRELVQLVSRHTGRSLKLETVPRWLQSTLLRAAGWFSPLMRGNAEAMAYVSSGQYVADTSEQRRLFGPPPSLEESVARWVREAGLAPAQAPSAAWAVP